LLNYPTGLPRFFELWIFEMNRQVIRAGRLPSALSRPFPPVGRPVIVIGEGEFFAHLSKKETKAILVALSKKFPATWSRITKKRYILPQYRQADYYDQDDLNLQSLDYFITRYKRIHNP